MSDTQNVPSFDEFPIPSFEDWHAAAVESLDGASFEKSLTTGTYEGLTLQPFYRQEDIADIAHPHTLPGQPPFVRGTQAAGYVGRPWYIAQKIPYATPKAFNETLRRELECGQDAINLDGVSLNSLDELAQAFADIDLTRYPIISTRGTISFVKLLEAHLGPSIAELHGCIACDPLGELALSGTLPSSIHHAYDEMAQLTQWAIKHAPKLKTVAVNADVYHNSGANAVQELAFAIGGGVEYIRHILNRGLSIDTIAPRLQFTFALGSQFFTEVAKLRAARQLWAQVVSAFGGSEGRMNLHTCTSAINKTVYDPYVNMLRTTIEAFAGAAGGTDSMQVAPFDAAIRPPDEFSQRISRNQQLILQHEVGLTHTIDPAGGSYYVEYLTDWLAQQAWALFQEVEKQGGLYKALQAGFVQKQIIQVAAQRVTNMERRKDLLVGINIYPNLVEEPPSDVPPFEQRSKSETKDKGTSITPLGLLRLAEPYETLRQNAAVYRQRTGTAPRIFLANLGSYRARADFTTGFFEVGGFQIINHGRFESPEEAAQAALDSGAPAVVICSTDDNYPQIVPLLVSQLKAQKPGAVVILSGYPQDQIDMLRAAGVDEFIHIRANCYNINSWLQQQIGVNT
jgi:methylmalonyl-CoA mutase